MMKLKRMILAVFTVLLVLLVEQFCLADSATQRGFELALEADRRTSGFGDFTAEMEMILRDRKGREGHRQISISIMETVRDGDKGLTIFNSPGDVKGTALLTHGHKVDDDDQWLYLPALKRVKRISSRNKSGSFMGSEFAYEDFGSREVEKYTYRFIGADQLNGRDCFMLERYPKDQKNSGYSRIVTWLDQDEYQILKEDYFDKRKRLLKTLTLSDYRLYINTIWRAHFMHMVNHQTGKETDLVWADFVFKSGLSDKDFNKNSLRRAR